MRRDGALARLSSVTAAIAVATIVGVGALGLYVGRALPGHHSGSVPGASTSTGGTGNTGQASQQAGLNPPSTPTQGASLPAPVTSGSS